MSEEKKKVVLCLPVYAPRPTQATLDSIRDEVPHLEKAGWEHSLVHELGCPYISAARATMLRKALDSGATHVFFIDSDVSWEAGALTKVMETEGEVVAGTYRFKSEEVKYMGSLRDRPDHRPIARISDGAINAINAPAGFLKVSRTAINLMMDSYPELCFGEKCSPHFDIFNHGAHKGVWWGEDYAMCRRWVDEMEEPLWIVPNINVDHNGSDGTVYKGNFHRYLLGLPGGSESANPNPPKDWASI